MNRPKCGKCGGEMTPENSRIHPEFFLHDGCLPEELQPKVKVADGLTDAERAIVSSLGIGTLLVLVAWANADLSEGEASKVLSMDRVDARERLHAAAKAGQLVAAGKLTVTRLDGERRSND